MLSHQAGPPRKLVHNLQLSKLCMWSCFLNNHLSQQLQRGVQLIFSNLGSPTLQPLFLRLPKTLRWWLVVLFGLLRAVLTHKYEFLLGLYGVPLSASSLSGHWCPWARHWTPNCSSLASNDSTISPRLHVYKLFVCGCISGVHVWKL